VSGEKTGLSKEHLTYPDKRKHLEIRYDENGSGRVVIIDYSNDMNVKKSHLNFPELKDLLESIDGIL